MLSPVYEERYDREVLDLARTARRCAGRQGIIGADADAASVAVLIGGACARTHAAGIKAVGACRAEVRCAAGVVCPVGAVDTATRYGRAGTNAYSS